MENSSVFDWEQAFMEESLLLDENFVEIEQINLSRLAKRKIQRTVLPPCGQKKWTKF